MHITPKIRSALDALAGTPDARLVRCRGGYRPANATGPIITTRTINAMERDWLVELIGPFHSAAVLTRKGRQATANITAVAAAKAGAA